MPFNGVRPVNFGEMDVVKDSTTALPVSNEDGDTAAVPQPVVDTAAPNASTQPRPTEEPSMGSVSLEQQPDGNQSANALEWDKNGGVNIADTKGEELKDGGQTNDGGEGGVVKGSEDKDDASVMSVLSQEDFHSTLHEDMMEALDSIQSQATFAALHKLEKDSASVPPSQPSAAQLTAQVTQDLRPLKHALRRWLSAPHDTRAAHVLYYGLDHEYTFADDRLRARDLAVVKALRQLSRNLPFHVFVAVLERKEVGFCESSPGHGGYDNYRDCGEDEDEDEDESDAVHYIDDIREVAYTIEKLDVPGGQQLGASMTFNIDDAVQDEDDFFPEDPDHEEYDGYKGNSKPQATHWYRKSAVVIVPTDHLVEYLAGSNLHAQEITAHLESLTRYFRDVCVNLARTDLKEAQHLWDDFYHGIIVSHSGLARVQPQANSKTVRLLLCTTLRLGDRELWAELVSSVAGARVGVNLSFFAWIRRKLLAGEFTWEGIEERLSMLIDALPNLQGQYDAIKTLVVEVESNNNIAVDPSHIGQAVGWARQTSAKLIMALSRPLGTADAAAILKFVFDRQFGLGFTALKESIVPVFHRNIRNFAFSLSFVTGLYLQCGPHKTSPINDQVEIISLYKELVAALIDILDISALRSAEALLAHQDIATKTARSSYTYASDVEDQLTAPPPNCEQLERVVDGWTVLTFLTQVINEDLPATTVLKLCLKVAEQANNIRGTELHYLWLPVLRDLIASWEEPGEPHGTPQTKQLLATFLKAYLKNYVGKEPLSRDQNHAQPWSRLRAQTLENWEERRDNAKEQIKHFDQVKLREVLGTDYEPIARSFGLGITTAPAGPNRQIAQPPAVSEQLSDQSHGFLTPMSGNRGPTLAPSTPSSLGGTKRKMGDEE